MGNCFIPGRESLPHPSKFKGYIQDTLQAMYTDG